MVAVILSVGTELLLGDIINSNAAFLARALKELGIAVYFQSVVGDNRERLAHSLKAAALRSDIIIMTGGLGPTDDDLTKETVAEYLNREMELDEKSWAHIREYFKKLGREITGNNKKQALFPKGCVILKNEKGTAPGCVVEENGKTFIMLPGPPEEMEAMFINEVLPILRKKSDGVFYSKTLRVCGIGESAAEDMLKELIASQTNPTIAPYAKASEVHLRVTAAAMDLESAKKLAAPTIARIYEILGDNIYGEDDTTLEEAVVTLLAGKKFTVACAESCTGGMLSARLINVAGVSEVFMEGVVSYSNESKISRLGVSPQTLKKYGAVSAQTAAEMAAGVVRPQNCNVGVSITGVAGPDAPCRDENHTQADGLIQYEPGGAQASLRESASQCLAKKEAGLVFIGIYLNGDITVREFRFKGDRQKIRNSSVVSALDLLRRILNGTEKSKRSR